MSNDGLADGKAKGIMRGWPKVTKSLFGGTDQHPWIRAQPKNKGDHATTPYILTAGNTALKTQPDGMYLLPVNDFMSLDVVCFEVCSSLQNFQDKRSRYSPTTASLIIETRANWWNEAVHGRVTRWKKVSGAGEKAEADQWFPIRYLRVVYVLRNAHLDQFREHGVAAGHEYFIRNSSLSSMTAGRFLKFLERLSPSHHFYTQ